MPNSQYVDKIRPVWSQKWNDFLKKEKWTGERQTAWHFTYLRDVAKVFSEADGSSLETKAKLRGCLAFDDTVGGGPVLYKLWDAGSNCVTALMERWSPTTKMQRWREWRRGFTTPKKWTRHSISQNPLERRQEVDYVDWVHHKSLQITFSLPL